jgi:hypothetical protein
MKEEPRIIPFLGIGNLIDAGRAPFLPGEKCLDKSTGKVVTVLSCEPVNIKNISLADIKLLGLPDDATPFDVIKRHPGKEWAWRITSEPE